jgi:glycosyltransferase involved in cell wall biosynthesis
MNKLRVCIVAENHPQARMGGAEYQTQLLAEQLASRADADVSYLALRVPAADRIRPYTLLQTGRDSWLRRRAAFFDAFALTRRLEEIRPHVIYQQMKQSYTAVCARYARRHGIPFYFHVASDADLDGSWVALRLGSNTLFDCVEELLGNWGVRHATHVVVQSTRQQRLLRERHQRDASILVRNFQPLPERLAEKSTAPSRVLWVGNFKDVKQPELFVELARSLVGDQRFWFDMIGRPAVSRRFEPMMRAISELPNLKYHGELSIDAVNELMVGAGFFVNTSRFEGFPNTFVQAWARGAIVLSLVVDPLEGMERLCLGYRAGTVDKLRALLLELQVDPGRCAGLRRRSHDYALENHSMVQAERLAELMIRSAVSPA